MVARSRLILIGLAGSLVMNVVLAATLWSNAAFIDEVATEMDRVASTLTTVAARCNAASREADELRDHLKSCRIDLIKRALGNTSRRSEDAVAPDGDGRSSRSSGPHVIRGAAARG